MLNPFSQSDHSRSRNRGMDPHGYKEKKALSQQAETLSSEERLQSVIGRSAPHLVANPSQVCKPRHLQDPADLVQNRLPPLYYGREKNDGRRDPPPIGSDHERNSQKSRRVQFAQQLEVETKTQPPTPTKPTVPILRTGAQPLRSRSLLDSKENLSDARDPTPRSSHRPPAQNKVRVPLSDKRTHSRQSDPPMNASNEPLFSPGARQKKQADIHSRLDKSDIHSRLEQHARAREKYGIADLFLSNEKAKTREPPSPFPVIPVDHPPTPDKWNVQNLFNSTGETKQLNFTLERIQSADSTLSSHSMLPKQPLHAVKGTSTEIPKILKTGWGHVNDSPSNKSSESQSELLLPKISSVIPPDSPSSPLHGLAYSQDSTSREDSFSRFEREEKAASAPLPLSRVEPRPAPSRIPVPAPSPSPSPSPAPAPTLPPVQRHSGSKPPRPMARSVSRPVPRNQTAPYSTSSFSKSERSNSSRSRSRSRIELSENKWGTTGKNVSRTRKTLGYSQLDEDGDGHSPNNRELGLQLRIGAYVPKDIDISRKADASVDDSELTFYNKKGPRIQPQPGRPVKKTTPEDLTLVAIDYEDVRKGGSNTTTNEETDESSSDLFGGKKLSKWDMFDRDSKSGECDDELLISANLPPPKRKKENKVVLICMLVFLVFFCLAVGLPIYFKAAKEGDDETPKFQPPCFIEENNNLFSDRYDTIRKFMMTTAAGDVWKIDEPGSAQRRAICWLADLDERQVSVSKGNIPAAVQRYSLAVVYYSLVDENSASISSLENTGFLSSSHECDWGVIMCNMPETVTALLLADKHLTGAIPEEVSNLKHLSFLELSLNELSGGIPESIERLSMLGTLPKELGSLTKLEFVNMRSSQIHGTIPSELGQLTSLETLLLEGNWLSGTIPSTLGNLHKAQQMSFRKNYLSAGMPDEICELRDESLSELKVDAWIECECCTS